MQQTDVEVELPERQPGRLVRIAGSLIRWLYTLAVPLLLTLLSARLVMMPAFLHLEYNRPGFPEDTYGFTTEERITYGTEAVNYLLLDSDIAMLADMRFDNGTPMFTSLELRHMIDVKHVTRAAFSLLWIGGFAMIALSIWLVLNRNWRRVLYDGLFRGAVLTLGLISAIVILAIVAWDIFFTAFHQAFFESGTWRFAFSDTLIRLFPQQFWFDAALVVGGLTTISAAGILYVVWRLIKRA